MGVAGPPVAPIQGLTQLCYFGVRPKGTEGTLDSQLAELVHNDRETCCTVLELAHPPHPVWLWFVLRKKTNSSMVKMVLKFGLLLCSRHTIMRQKEFLSESSNKELAPCQ